MPAFCDVALPLPVDRVFTYAVAAELPSAGGRVLVPFRNEKLSGVVTRLHDEAPDFEVKPILSVVDQQAILSPQLMELGAWIAQYYIAPLGEVLRAMLPLMAEVKRHVSYSITDTGRKILFEASQSGSSRRSRLAASEQDIEYSVLEHLEAGTALRIAALRSRTGASTALLANMTRKKWIARATAAEQRQISRTQSFAVLAGEIAGGTRLPKLNGNQQAMLAELTGAGGALPVAVLRGLHVPASTLATLVKRGLVQMEERPDAFHLTGLQSNATAHVLNRSQQVALDSISAALHSGKFQPLLLYGITGSGKTAVYLAAMRQALASGKSSILLVPEIGLTPQTAAQLHHAFGAEVALLHSALTPEERVEQWHRIERGEARVVVGTRSAIFAPVDNLGLILVDEEHDSSYKQESVPRYNARDVAVMRAKFAGAAVVLGSATPSLESWHNATQGKYARIEMLDRVKNRPLPEVELLDMRREFQETGQEQLFSRALIEQTQATLDRGEQAIILLNRRGYSFVVLCRACGKKLECENCSISLTYHKAVSMEDAQAQPGRRLECHYCGYKKAVPKLCPECESEHLYFLGAGSQQGEERLQEIFPAARIGRMDRDTIRGRNDMERLLMRLHSGEINLLVGTQMIAKGHDIHGVTLVGVVGADHALSMPDFRAAERVFQLLTQVSGRAGRGELPGKVVVQTYHPEHYAIQHAATHDFLGFAEKELKYRRWMHYPPFSPLTNLMVQSPHFAEAAGWSELLGRFVRETTLPGVRVLGPSVAPISRIKRIHRFHLVLKAETRQNMQRAVRRVLRYAEGAGIPRRNLIVDVDAVSLM